MKQDDIFAITPEVGTLLAAVLDAKHDTKIPQSQCLPVLCLKHYHYYGYDYYYHRCRHCCAEQTKTKKKKKRKKEKKSEGKWYLKKGYTSERIT